MKSTSNYNGKINVISKQLRRYRENRNMSLAQLSSKLQLLGIDISKSSLQNIESGKRTVKEYEFYALCRVFNISMEEMLKDFIDTL